MELKEPIMLKPPLCLVGYTAEAQPVLGGAFAMADTLGVPLAFSMDKAEEKGCVISIPHYFACAIEHGWDDTQAFGKISEALTDRGKGKDFERVQLSCIVMFSEVAGRMPEGATATEVAHRMRRELESDALAHKVAAEGKDTP
jgi:hypothetical protein